jgi:cell division septal protein FtsQ
MVKPLKTRTRKKGGKFSLKLGGALQKILFTSLPFILSLAAVGVLLGCVLAYAVNSPTFQLDEVRVNIGNLTPGQAFDFCELKKGENLISLDLVNVQQVIKRKHPEYKEVLVRRVLPNRIDVELKRRTPLAQVAFSRFVPIDKDLVLLPDSSAVPFKNLTIIQGVKTPPENAFIGAPLKDGNTKKAVKLMDYIKRSNTLKNHFLTKVDISDPKNIFLIVDGDIEIRIGSSHLIERLKILEQTMKSIEFDRSRIRYIDLRFDDVVIGPR